MSEQKKGCLVCRKGKTCSYIQGFRNIDERTGSKCPEFEGNRLIKEVVQFT